MTPGSPKLRDFRRDLMKLALTPEICILAWLSITEKQRWLVAVACSLGQLGILRKCIYLSMVPCD